MSPGRQRAVSRSPSLHRFLLWRILLVVVPIVLAGMALHGHFARRLLLEQFHADLVDKASTLATLVIQHDQRISFEFADEYMPEFSRAEQPLYFHLRTADGRSLERSYSLGGQDLPFARGPLSDPATFHARLADGVDVRGVGIEFPPRLGPEGAAEDAAPVVLSLAAPATHLDAMLRRGHVQVVVTGLLSVTCIAIVVWLALRRGVYLLERVVGEVQRISPAELERPIDAQRAPEEIRPIIEALNGSLDRIRGFVERERRFTADVAHELRTPISELRAAADVALLWPDEASRRRLPADARDIALQMGGLVESLLELAVLEGEGSDGSSEELDLVDVARRVLEQLSSEAGRKRPIELDCERSLRLRSFPRLWEVALRNLVDNALCHSSVAGTVRIRLRPEGRGAHVCVSNPAQGLTTEDARRCTERLWRADRRTNGHHGLGLSIVQAACAKLGHGFSTRLEDGVFYATIVPLQGSPPQPDGRA